MSRKFFISFLGTNNYVLCRYDINGVVSEPVRFVQEALIEYQCKDWSENDKVLIFCTSRETTGENGSKEINWLDNGQSRVSDELEKIGLQHRLQELKKRLGLKAQIEEHDIEAGFSEGEIWRIFDSVFAKLEPDSEIYFDVTHAFRSIPLFSIVLFNYAKFMLNTRLVSIMYGAFEKLGPAYQVKEKPVEQRIAPVIDLTNIAKLQEYNQIASGLKDFGKVKLLKEAIAVNKGTTSDQTIRDLAASISELDEYIATIDLKAIKNGKFIRKFRNNYRSVKKKKKLVKPISNILDELFKETADFVEENSYLNIEAAISWTIKHDMLMQTYPLASEYIISRISDAFIYLKPTKLPQKRFRLLISSMLGMPDELFNNKVWKESSSESPEVADKISVDPLIISFRPIYNPIREARNSLAHGNGSIKYAELIDGLPNITKCIDFLNQHLRQTDGTK